MGKAPTLSANHNLLISQEIYGSAAVRSPFAPAIMLDSLPQVATPTLSSAAILSHQQLARTHRFSACNARDLGTQGSWARHGATTSSSRLRHRPSAGFKCCSSCSDLRGLRSCSRETAIQPGLHAAGCEPTVGITISVKRSYLSKVVGCDCHGSNPMYLFRRIIASVEIGGGQRPALRRRANKLGFFVCASRNARMRFANVAPCPFRPLTSRKSTSSSTAAA